MDTGIAKKTQETLGKVIKRPPLTEKLLSKPPFRFLHDVITEVIKNTGQLKGLYTSAEMNSANVTEREAKMTFLQKAIDCVSMVSGDTLSARPSKIVAGHEPEKTNEFLQALGIICIKKADSSDAVRKVLAGEKPSSGKSSRKKESSSGKERSTSKDRSASKERKEGQESSGDKGKSSSKKDDRGRKKEKSKEEDRKDRDDRKKESSAKGRESKRSEQNSAKEREKEKNTEKEKVNEKENEKREREKEKERAREREREKARQNELEAKSKMLENEEDQSGSRNIQRPSSAKGQRRRPSHPEGDKHDQDEDDEDGVIARNLNEDSSALLNTSQKPKAELSDDQPARQQSGVRRMARPSSARPAPPRIKKQEESEESLPRVSSGTHQVASVIVDNVKDPDDDDDDDDTTFVVEENDMTPAYFDQGQGESTTDLGTEDHGSLVKKMLESKKEAEVVQKKGPKYEQEKPIIETAARKKERELAEKEIDRLRNSIQTLCRSAHPLGKIMDYLQEDIDSMQKELEMWRKENQQHKLSLKAEQSITESEIEPLQAQLGELEFEMSDMMEKISGIKCNIIKNDEKIQELAQGIAG